VSIGKHPGPMGSRRRAGDDFSRRAPPSRSDRAVLPERRSILIGHGQPRAGKVSVAGLTTEEIRTKLLFLMMDRDLPSLSAAVGAALDEWSACCGNRVASTDRSGALNDTSLSAEGVQHHGGRVLHPPAGGGGL
jgi:hypothetical protein